MTQPLKDKILELHSEEMYNSYLEAKEGCMIKNQEKGWSYIGVVEFNNDNFSPNGSHAFDEWVLYMRVGEGCIHYTITDGHCVLGRDYWIKIQAKTPISIKTFLTMYVSTSPAYGKAVKLFDGAKIKIKGLTDWIEEDDDYKFSRISLKELNNKLENE
jgi:hypothetical protein